jgi:hypothetical protein
MIMKKMTLAVLLLFCILTSNAQSRSATGSSYRTALGVKVWDGAGITLKHFGATGNAIEGIGYFYNRGFRLTGLYEIHRDIDGAQGLKWYFGPGAHIGFYNNKFYDDDRVVLGIDGVLGLDYKFNTAPINLSLDWQPSIEFASKFGFNGNWGGLGIRYTF